MGENSNIEWTDHTWNPWYGCTKVSQGCVNCYMYREMKQYGKDPTVVQRSKTTFYKPYQWAKRYPGQTVFTCSWGDFFHPAADAWRPQAWEIIGNTPNLIYLILTKRIELAAARLPEDWGRGWPHVWIGVSIEDQAAAKMRLKHLIELPAAHRFLSLGPLLSFVDLVAATPAPTAEEESYWDEVNSIDDESEPEQFIEECDAECDWINYGNDLVVNPEWRDWVNWRKRMARKYKFLDKIHWVIAEGESGPGARTTHPDWVRGPRDLCAGRIPFFFKSWGDNLPLEADPATTALGQGRSVQFLAVGKREAGRVLDGREWLELPEEFKR